MRSTLLAALILISATASLQSTLAQESAREDTTSSKRNPQLPFAGNPKPKRGFLSVQLAVGFGLSTTAMGFASLNKAIALTETDLISRGYPISRDPPNAGVSGLAIFSFKVTHPTGFGVRSEFGRSISNPSRNDVVVMAT